MNLLEAFELYLKEGSHEYLSETDFMIIYDDYRSIEKLDKLYVTHKIEFMKFIKPIFRADNILYMLKTGLNNIGNNADIIHELISESSDIWNHYNSVTHYAPNILFDACVKYMERRHKLIPEKIKEMGIKMTDDVLRVMSSMNNRQIWALR